jgi:hypothetical protein
LFGSFVLIDLSQALTITPIVWFLDRSGLIFFMGLYWFEFIHSIMGHQACSIVETPGV